MRRLRRWWDWVVAWLTLVEPTYRTQVGASRDRSLRGKARRRARQHR